MAQNAFQETPCRVVVRNNFDTHGTVTRATIDYLTPQQLYDLFITGSGTQYKDMDAWFKTSFEMQACGTKINGFYNWLMSSQRNMKGLISTVNIDRGPGLLQPFVLGRQDSVINQDYWVITQGQAVSAYTAGVTGPLQSADLALGASTDRVIRVVTRYGFDLDAKWFIARDRVHIFSNSSGNVMNGQWKVLASAAASDLSYIDVVVTSENAGSVTPYATAPTSGVLLAGANNVNDFESWCQNRPTLDPRKRVPYWFQTMRRTRRVDSEYKKVYARLMESNDYFREFGDLDLAQRNAQDENEFQRRWCNAFMFGKPISANQTLALWQNLEQITTASGVINTGLGGKLIAYRANMVGIYEQLKACDRVRNLQNNPLNFYEWLDENYRIMRARKSQGKQVDSIDWFTDSFYAAQLESAFILYYKQEYADTMRINVTTGTNEFGFSWKTFEVKYPPGLKINIVTHDFFNDMADAFNNESIPHIGRMLLALEIGSPGPKGGTIYPGMIATNRKMRTLGEIENLAKIDSTIACTMEGITEEISLTSETCTAVCECPANSVWIQGMTSAVPVVTGKTQGTGQTYTDLYGFAIAAFGLAASLFGTLC